MITSSFRIRLLLNDIKKRWKKRAIKQGLALFIFTFLFFFATYFLLEYRFDFPPFFRGLGITIAAAVLLFVLIQYLIRPSLKRLDNEKIALLVEEKIPELEDRLNSAVDINRKFSNRDKDLIIDKIINDVTYKVGSLSLSTVVDRKKERILSYTSNALLILFLILIFTFSDDISNLAGQMEVSLNPVPQLEQEFLSVMPGDIEIEKGESQEILVELKKNTEKDVILHYSMGEDDKRKLVMEKGLDRPVYLKQFINIREPVKYYVEFNGNLSPEYTISIYEFPKVTKIDIKYDYPEYTGIPSRTDENTGDIRGLKGSSVLLTVETNGTAVSGEMIKEDGTNTVLEPLENGKFRTSIVLNDTGFYHIKLTDSGNKNNKYPEEYRIIPVHDELPIIYITDPQKDVKANLVEEVMIAATVSDDYGVNDVKLTYSLNGEEEKSIVLYKSKQENQKNIKVSHMFFLEDYVLQPGDAISYYIEAKDNCVTNDYEYSDMYFIEITALNTRYTQANNRGGGSGSGSRQSQVVLNQQKIIAATWKLKKTRKKYSSEEFNESLEALTTSQSNLKENISGRLDSPALSQDMLDEDTKKIAENLKNAVKEMDEALDELGRPDLKKAIKEEQQALKFLLRAEALNDERRVRRQQAGGSGSGGGGNQEQMSELLDLELDDSKDKYEIQQQRQQEQQNQEVDEALQKVKELARRQEKLADRAQQNLNEENEKRFLDRLKRDQEQLRQEAEELTNRMRRMSRDNSQLSRSNQQRMEEVSRNMRKAEEALNRKDTQEALSRQQMAINELERLSKDMQMSQSDNYREMTKEFVEKFDRLKQQEQSLEKDINQTYEDLKNNPQKQLDKSNIKRLNQKRETNLKNLRDISNEAEALENKTKRENPEISTTLKNFRKDLKQEDIDRNMRISRSALKQGWLTYAKIKEYEIRESLDNLGGQIRKLENNLPMSEEEKLNRSLKDVRDLLTRYNDVKNSIQQNLDRDQQAGNNKNDQSGQQNKNQQGQQNKQNRQNSGRNQQSQGQNQGQNQQNSGQPGGNSRGENREEAARLQRQVEQMRQQVDGILRNGRNNPQMQSTLESMRNNLARLDNTGELLDEAGLDYFKQNVFKPLSGLEFQLLRKMDEVEMEKKLHGGRKADVPARYRKIVEKYYETISKSKSGNNK